MVATNFSNVRNHFKIVGIGNTDIDAIVDSVSAAPFTKSMRKVYKHTWQYVSKIMGSRGVIFVTGTPISNSMVEMYSVKRYLQYDILARNG